MYQFQSPLEVSDFSGGITDNYIDCPLNQYQKADNLLIEKNKKLISRYGTVIYDSSATRITGNARIGAMINHPASELWFQTGAEIYRITGGAFSELVGPVDSNNFMSASTVSNYISHSQWQNHVYAVSDGMDDPKKIYKDSGGTWRLRSAGLPALELEGAIDLANAIRTAYEAHRANATEHTAADSTNVISAPAAHSLATLITLVTELLTDFNAHEADDDAGAGSFHDAQEAGDATLSSTAAPTTLAECITRLADLRSKYNTHDADTTSHDVGSQHQVSAQKLPTITSGAGALTFIYAFFYRYTYTVGDVTFENVSSVATVSQGSLDSGTKSIANIPAIANGSTRCWDTSTITVEIYRTIASGTTFYRVGSVTNGTTTFSDTVSDANLVNNQRIYTDGGVLEHDQPPPAKFCVIVNDIGWFFGVKEGSTTHATRWRQSLPGNPDACPESLSDDVETDFTGASSIGVYPIAFCRNRVYRMEGFYDRFGRGNVQEREISREKGTVSHNSIVRIPATAFSPAGLVFAGTDGFYFTDGYSVKPISTHLVTSYKALVTTTAQEKRIYGRYDSAENRVYWAMSATSSSTDNDKLFVLDLNFPPVKDTEWVFTTMSNSNSWGASAIEFYGTTFVVADYRGYVFKFDTSTLTDPKVDTGVAVSSWSTSAITYDYRSFATTFGSVSTFKFIPSITMQCKNRGNVSIQIKSNNEDSGVFRDLKEVRVRDGITWGDPNVEWNDPDINYLWNSSKIIRVLRLFPSGHLRTVYKQIQITNSDTIIYNSDTLGVATSSGSANTMTLDDVSQTLPTDIVDYKVAFSNDSYENEFTISARNSATQLTYSDGSNLAPTASGLGWIIRGTRKSEQINLLSFALNFAPVYQHQDAYRGNTGGNAS